MSTSAALAKIETVFKHIIPSAPFEYKFADEEFALKFTTEERIGKLAAFFGSLAVIISCLGLFGLATFIAARRTKEISVRKILGASIFHCWQLLSSEFVVLVMLSALLAIPLSWYLMHSWIQDYTYRTDLSWWIFAAATLGALLITLCTVSVQSIAAALRSPIHSLRNE
jgi:ABC-type antimicrobial peptide transport system permease subunit